MQVLWSRAAQAKSSCSCRSCLHTATNLARRTTTAVGKRRVRVSDVVTACYSTILATAAVADMRVKDDRRREWDRVIAEARAGTPTNESRPERSDNIDATESNFSTGFGPSPKNIASSYRPIAVGNRTTGLHSALEIKLRKIGSQLEDEIHLTEEEQDVRMPAREPMKPIHLARMQDMIARLAYKFLTMSKIFSADGIQGNDDIQLQTLNMKERLQSLMAGFSNLPSFEWNDAEVVFEQRDALNRSLYTICRSTAANDLAGAHLMLAKISYNLLVSTSPPSMATYNLLLAEFTRLGKPNFAQVVVDSFMYDSRLKPSKTTIKLLLDHYRAKGDLNGYRSIVLRMRATRRVHPDLRYDSPDLRVGKREIKDLHKPAVQRWALGTKTIHRNGALYEKVHRDAAIFDSQINGCLELQGLPAAIRQIRSAFREGHEVNQNTLCSVIRVCLSQANFSNGLKLLRTIISLWASGVEHLINAYSTDLRQLICQLMVMCGFDTSLKSQKDMPSVASRDALQDLLHFMHIESLDEALNRCAAVTILLSQSIGLTRPGDGKHVESQEPLGILETPDIDLAIQIMEDYAREQQLHISHQRSLEAASRWSRLEALERLVDARWSSFLEVENGLTSLMCAGLSRHNKRVYYGTVSQIDMLSPKVAYLEKHRLLLQLGQPKHTISKQAAIDVEQPRSPGVDQISVTLREVSPRPVNGASLRQVEPLPVKPFRSPFPMSISLAAMREKAELEAAAS